MPVTKCSNGKYKIGSGNCMYESKEKAEKAYKGYLASKREEMKYEIEILSKDLNKIREELDKQKKIVSKYGSNK